MIFETVPVGNMQVNCYILASSGGSSAVIIDPGAEAAKIRAVLKKHALQPAFVINTHGHFDHIGCDDEFGVPVYAHSRERPLLKDPRLNLSGLFDTPVVVRAKIKDVEDGDEISLDDIHFKVLHIPGHSPGGIALFLKTPDEKFVFTGDALFFRGIGRTDFQGGDSELLIRSIRKTLLNLPPETVVCPGHGPTSTIGSEKERNPSLHSA